MFTFLIKLFICKTPTTPSLNVLPFSYHFLFIKSRILGWNLSRPIVILNALRGLCKLYEKEGFFSFKVFTRTYLILFKAKAVEATLKHSRNITRASEMINVLKPLIKDGIFVSDGNLWKSQRKYLNPAFHSQVLKEYISTFNKESQHLVKELKELQSQAGIVDVTEHLKSYSVNTALKTVMQCAIDTDVCNTKILIEAIDRYAEELAYISMRPWLWPNILLPLSKFGRKHLSTIKVIQDFVDHLFKVKAKTMANKCINRSGTSETLIEECDEGNSSRKRSEFLDLLFEMHFKDKDFTEYRVKQEICTFIIAGTDTVSSTLTHVLHNIGLYAVIQDKILAELKAVFGNDKERYITYEDLNKMTYLECVIKESMRLHPVSAYFGRSLRYDTKIGDNLIKAGSMCLIDPYTLHRDPEIYPNPESFIPDRFLPENSRGRSSCSYIPFAVGPRACIGQTFGMMSMKVILANILRNFEIRSLDPEDKLDMELSFVIRLKSPLRIKLTAH